MRWLILFALLAACGDNGKGHPQDAGVDTTTPDAPGRLTGCLDTPVGPSAPNGQLPCDLIPPGLTP
jgi:hypothetical protein